MLVLALPAAALVILPPASSAQAAPAWTNLPGYAGSTAQACARSTADGKVKVRVRANNRKGTDYTIAGIAPVRPDGRPALRKRVDTIPGAHPGEVSAPVSLKLPADAKVYLHSGSEIGLTHWRTLRVRDVRPCR